MADISYANHSSLLTLTTLRQQLLVWAADDEVAMSEMHGTPVNLQVARQNSVLIFDLLDQLKP